jgi:hypothetical protein
MHYVTRRSHQLQKHKFGVTCPGTLFVRSDPGPSEHENCASLFHTLDAPKHNTLPIDPTGSKSTSSAYCVSARFLWDPNRAHPSMKNIAVMFHTLDAPECTMCPIDSTGCKHTSSVYHVRMRFSWDPHRAHPSIKNSALTFCTTDALERTT